jgi:hypothetical protein
MQVLSFTFSRAYLDKKQNSELNFFRNAKRAWGGGGMEGKENRNLLTCLSSLS